MKETSPDRIFKLISCIVVVFFVCLLNIEYMFAATVPVELLDSGGKPIDLGKDVEKNSKQFIEVMKNELRVGNLASIGFIANILEKTIPTDPDVKSLYSIYLISTGNIENAKNKLASISEYQKDNIFALYANAMISQREGKYIEAEKFCKKAILKDEAHPYPRNILGRIYFAQRENEQALTSFKKAIEIEPKFLPAYSNLGAVNYAMENNAQAIVFFKKAIELDPNSFGPHLGLAIVYQTIGNNTLALIESIRSYEIDPSNVSLLQKIGHLQIQLAKYEDARNTGNQLLTKKIEGARELLGSAALHLGNIEEAVTQLQKDSDKSQEAAYLLGLCYIVKRDYEKALLQMEDAYKHNTAHFGSYITRTTLFFYLDQQVTINEDLENKWNDGTKKLLNFITGCVYSSKGQWEKAEKEFQAAESLISGFSFAGIDANILSNVIRKDELKHIALGVLLYMNDLIDSAYYEFDQATKINNVSFLANFWVAQTYLKKGDREKALSFFKKSLERAPSFFSSLYVVGELNFTKGDTKTAASYYKSALAVKKDNGLLIKIGLYHEYSKEYDKAANFYKEAIELSPENFIGYNQLAWLYAKRGVKLDTAMAYAQKANKLQPGNASILDTIGWTYFHKKEYKNALEYLEKSYAVFTNNPSVLYHLGVVHANLGNQSISKEFLNRALELSNTFEEAGDARKQLISQ